MQTLPYKLSSGLELSILYPSRTHDQDTSRMFQFTSAFVSTRPMFESLSCGVGIVRALASSIIWRKENAHQRRNIIQCFVIDCFVNKTHSNIINIPSILNQHRQEPVGLVPVDSIILALRNMGARKSEIPNCTMKCGQKWSRLCRAARSETKIRGDAESKANLWRRE